MTPTAGWHWFACRIKRGRGTASRLYSVVKQWFLGLTSGHEHCLGAAATSTSNSNRIAPPRSSGTRSGPNCFRSEGRPRVIDDPSHSYLRPLATRGVAQVCLAYRVCRVHVWEQPRKFILAVVVRLAISKGNRPRSGECGSIDFCTATWT
ncbi:MAG: hypothetical protein JWN70_571 [Planctomycetaceae bacterium]|nr:hypothetical protein [Planctomycetaceae bacterium]